MIVAEVVTITGQPFRVDSIKSFPGKLTLLIECRPALLGIATLILTVLEKLLLPIAHPDSFGLYSSLQKPRNSKSAKSRLITENLCPTNA